MEGLLGKYLGVNKREVEEEEDRLRWLEGVKKHLREMMVGEMAVESSR
jgi:hypothetical protein